MRSSSSPQNTQISFDQCRGDQFRAIYLKVSRIIAQQFANPNVKGINGFIFYGETGVGKTHLAKMLAYELSIPILFVDSATVARKHYGDSEHLITKLFEEAMHNKSILLFDDVEALFLDRTKESSENWNASMNNVLFHQLDNLNTSRCAVILTTNLIDFIDKALRDRLYPIEFPLPKLETAIAIAQLRSKELDISPENVEMKIRSAPDEFRSIRAVEKLVLEEYIDQIGRATPKLNAVVTV